jgi:hypothetical protein
MPDALAGDIAGQLVQVQRDFKPLLARHLAVHLNLKVPRSFRIHTVNLSRITQSSKRKKALDLVHPKITGKESPHQTGLGEKSLHRMLNRNGNPTARNLGVISKSIAENPGIESCVKFA